jgi:DNA-binding NarL/FixJ family response regulator
MEKVMSNAPGITVFLADNLLVRVGVRALLQRRADLNVVGTAADDDGRVLGSGPESH